jgi:predicted nucleic acid-binding protein
VKPVFADTFYWIAIFLPNDPWFQAARSVDLSDRTLVTTEEVLAEFLTAVSRYGGQTRRLACRFVREILKDPSVEVVEQSHESFLGGLTLYEGRQDKQYSLVDCVSMNVMRRRRVREVLTQDRHFFQEGFIRLLPSED